MPDEEPRRPGRPKGTTKRELDAHDLAAQELLAWVKLTVRTRHIVERQLKGFEQMLENNSIGLEGQLQILSGLKDVLAAATRIIQSGMAAVGNTASAPADDLDAIRKEILE